MMSKPVGDLKNRTLAELHEILDREKKLLSNKAFINKLPDKGEKIRQYYNKVLKEIEDKNQIEESCKLLSGLNITSEQTFIPTKSNVENIEWRSGDGKFLKEHCLDSDDDSEPEDPISIIAGNTDVKKKIVYLKEEEKLITEEDLKEIKEMSDVILDGHTKYICNKTDKSNLHVKQSFKPFKTLKTDINDPCREIEFKRGDKWEVTAATVPPSIYGPVKEIPIPQSLKLHEIQAKQLKEIQIKHAAEKLASQLHKGIGKVPESLLTSKEYRDTTLKVIESDSDESEHETSDQELNTDEPRDGGVTFTVYE